MLVLSAKHFFKTSLPTSTFKERFSLLTTNRVILRFKFWDKLAFKANRQILHIGSLAHDLNTETG